MSHFAEINKNGIVQRVLVAEQDFINSGTVGDPSNWIQTSYNTYGGKHKLGGKPLRMNFAGINYSYDKKRDAFIPPQPYNSWLFNENTCLWDSPVPYPSDGNRYNWNEEKINWEQIVWDEKTLTWILAE
jgi:hypothetical protein